MGYKVSESGDGVRDWFYLKRKLEKEELNDCYLDDSEIAYLPWLVTRTEQDLVPARKSRAKSTTRDMETTEDT